MKVLDKPTRLYIKYSTLSPRCQMVFINIVKKFAGDFRFLPILTYPMVFGGIGRKLRGDIVVFGQGFGYKKEASGLVLNRARPPAKRRISQPNQGRAPILRLLLTVVNKVGVKNAGGLHRSAYSHAISGITTDFAREEALFPGNCIIAI